MKTFLSIKSNYPEYSFELLIKLTKKENLLEYKNNFYFIVNAKEYLENLNLILNYSSKKVLGGVHLLQYGGEFSDYVLVKIDSWLLRILSNFTLYEIFSAISIGKTLEFEFGLDNNIKYPSKILPNKLAKIFNID